MIYPGPAVVVQEKVVVQPQPTIVVKEKVVVRENHAVSNYIIIEGSEFLDLFLKYCPKSIILQNDFDGLLVSYMFYFANYK